MEIKGNYTLDKAFVGFDDDFNNKYMSKDAVLKLDGRQKDDMKVMAMMFARMDVEVTDNELIFKLNQDMDKIAKKFMEDDDMKANNGIIKYSYKKKGKKYIITSIDGEEEGEIEFKNDSLEFNYSTFKKI